MAALTWVTEADAFAQLQPEWDRLVRASVLPLPFLLHDYLRIWWEERGAGEWAEARLAVAVYRDDRGALAGAAPFFVTPTRHGPTMMLLGSHRLTDYLDVAVRPDAREGFFHMLGEALFGPERAFPQVRRWEWWNLLPQSPLLAAARGWAQRYGLDLTESPVEVAPYIPLPRSWEAYLAGLSKKQRHEIRRKLRRAQRQEAPVRWHRVEPTEDPEAACRTFFHLALFHPEKAAFFTEARRRWLCRVVQAAHRGGWLFLAFLTVGGEPAAAFLGFDFQQRLWIYNAGLHPAYRHLSPGWVLLAHILQWAIAQGYTELDFMRGPETYKYRFGARNRELRWVRLAVGG